MISLILWVVAAIFDAFIDTLEEGHFSNSIFKNLDPKFWSKSESWKYAKKIIGYPVDAWHLGKSAMIFCLAGAIMEGYEAFPISILNFLSLGLAWNLVFDLFYNYIFKKP